MGSSSTYDGWSGPAKALKAEVENASPPGNGLTGAATVCDEIHQALYPEKT